MTLDYISTTHMKMFYNPCLGLCESRVYLKDFVEQMLCRFRLASLDLCRLDENVPPGLAAVPLASRS